MALFEIGIVLWNRAYPAMNLGWKMNIFEFGNAVLANRNIITTSLYVWHHVELCILASSSVEGKRVLQLPSRSDLILQL